MAKDWQGYKISGRAYSFLVHKYNQFFVGRPIMSCDAGLLMPNAVWRGWKLQHAKQKTSFDNVKRESE